MANTNKSQKTKSMSLLKKLTKTKSRVIKNFLVILTVVLITKSNLYGDDKTLIIATEATYPPFEFIDEKGQISGFDINIIDKVCGKMKRKYKIIHQPSFDALLLGLKTNKFDIAIGAISINEERKKQIDFSIAYFSDNIGIIVHSDSKIKTKEDLKQKVIGLQSGTIFEDYTIDTYKNSVTIKRYTSISEGLLDLKNNRLDAYMGDASILKYWKIKSKNNKLHIIDVLDKKYENRMAIAVKKGNKELLKNINKALIEIKKQNQIQNISEKYFGYNNIKIKPFVIQLLKGSFHTIEIAIISLILGLIITFMFLTIKISNFKTASQIVDIIILIIKSLPELLIVITAYFVIPILAKKISSNIEIPPIILATTALGLIFSSYATSLIFEAYKSIPKGQIQSAISLGLKTTTINRRIILPQIIKSSLAGLNNLWLILLKDTSLVALVGVSEIMNRAKLAASATGRYFLFYCVAAMLYLIITSIFNLILKKYTK